MKIGLDLDGVIANWSLAAVSLLNDKKGYSLSLDEPPSWDYIESNVSKPDWRWLWKEGVEKHELFRWTPHYVGEIIWTRVLASLGDLFIITARPETARFDTLFWLDRWRVGPPKAVFFTSDKEKASGEFPTCDIYLDDKVENVEAMAKKGEAWMRTRSYNMWYAYQNRVNGLLEFVNAVRAKNLRG